MHCSDMNQRTLLQQHCPADHLYECHEMLQFLENIQVIAEAHFSCQNFKIRLND